MGKTGAKHNWTEADDAAALYVYRFGHRGVASSVSALAGMLGISPSSFRMRIQNFRAIDGGGGLSNYAQQSLRVHKRYGAVPEPELRAIVLTAIEKRGPVLARKR